MKSVCLYCSLDNGHSIMKLIDKIKIEISCMED